MDSAYTDTVRLLLAVAPVALAGQEFALKGGTAINLFVRDMPRLSVDLDLVCVDWRLPRQDAIAAISARLAAISDRLQKAGFEVRATGDADTSETTLLVRDRFAQVKVEVNTVFRGTVLPPEERPLCRRTAELFQMEMDVPVLAEAELHGSKLVAAMDRQHPRDLFDVHHLLEAEGIDPDVLECFVVYLAGHGRPIHEVLFGNDKDISVAFENTFVGMTTDPVDLGTLVEARRRIREEVRALLSGRHRDFLAGLARAAPDWSLLSCPHASQLPALRWKLANLEVFRERRPDEFRRQADELERRLRR